MEIEQQVESDPPVPVWQWSAEQDAIFDWFRNGSGHLLVRARAGTGKTTTLLAGVTVAPEAAILLCAFNKRIAEELQRRLSDTGSLNIEAKTLHAIGYQLIRQNWDSVTVDGRARATQLATEVLPPGTHWSIRKLFTDLHTKGRELLPTSSSPTDLLALAIEYDCVPEKWMEATGWKLSKLAEHAYRAMIKAEAPAPAIDFADMLYLPLRHGWTNRIYDLVVVDEAQDMTEPQLQLALGLASGRIVLVGDDRQAIYGFRGADSSALDRLKATLQADERGLKTTYRCGSLIVEAAQALVPDFLAAPGSHEGTIRSAGREALYVEASANDFVLSRTNAPIVPVALHFLANGIRCRIQGKDIGKNLLGLAQKLAKGSKAETIEEFLIALQEWEARESKRAATIGKDHLIEAIRDKSDTLQALTEDCATPSALFDRLGQLFADDGEGQIICSTVHKAKGLEADRVWILEDTFRFKGAEEDNIRYVTMTRARHELVWVH